MSRSNSPSIILEEAAGRDRENDSISRQDEAPSSECEPGQASFVFKEMLEGDDSAEPSFDQLERFGLFDVSICPDQLAEYRAKHPLPPEALATSPTLSDDFEPRPMPQHRHSIAISPSTLASSLNSCSNSPPFSSPDLGFASSSLSPFSFVRRRSQRQRPGQQRTKSSNDVVLPSSAIPVPSAIPEDDLQRVEGKRFSTTSTHTLPIDGSRSGSGEANLERDATIKEKRRPRKLKRNGPPKPILAVIRTDDDYLLRPTSEMTAYSTDPSPSPSPSLPPKPKTGWRASLVSLVSPVQSPTFEMPYELFPPTQPRSPSPIDTFPTAIRREDALPPIDRRRKDSVSDSYFGDSENQLHHSRPHHRDTAYADGRRPRSDTQSSVPSPSSPVATGNLWSRALAFGRDSSNRNRAKSRSSSSAASGSSWDVVEGELSTDSTSRPRTFEVIHPKKPLPPLPQSSSPSPYARSPAQSPLASTESFPAYESARSRSSSQHSVLFSSSAAGDRDDDTPASSSGDVDDTDEGESSDPRKASEPARPAPRDMGSTSIDRTLNNLVLA
ncbi:hypothetical protein JCM10212_001662 [Sporobolomyces blumeae]